MNGTGCLGRALLCAYNQPRHQSSYLNSGDSAGVLYPHREGKEEDARSCTPESDLQGTLTEGQALEEEEKSLLVEEEELLFVEHSGENTEISEDKGENKPGWLAARQERAKVSSICIHYRKMNKQKNVLIDLSKM